MKKIFLTLVVFIGISSVVYASQIEDNLFIKQGWNLIYGFTPNSLNGQNLDMAHIKAIYGFIPTTQEYARIYPKPEDNKIDLIGDGYLADTSFWVYSDSDAETEYWLQEPMPLKYVNEQKLYKGWNFFGTTPVFTNRRLEDVKGNCNILKSYLWGAGSQQWINLPLTEKLDEGDEESKWGGGNHVLGMVLKVAENCALGETKSDIPQIPRIPN